jgi:hypothetical protein
MGKFCKGLGMLGMGDFVFEMLEMRMDFSILSGLVRHFG